MKFISLTHTNHSEEIIINVEHISYMLGYSQHTNILLCGETVITVRESVEEIKTKINKM